MSIKCSLIRSIPPASHIFPFPSAYTCPEDYCGECCCLKGNIEERACNLALYIIENRTTVRAAARQFGISKSTVHMAVIKWNGSFGGCSRLLRNKYHGIRNPKNWPHLYRLSAILSRNHFYTGSGNAKYCKLHYS